MMVNLVVLVGPSGCGKSTLVKNDFRFESVDVGEIFLDDKLINNLVPSKKRNSNGFSIICFVSTYECL